MFCAQCGKQLPENAKFCPNCGNEIESYPEYDVEIIEQNQIEEVEEIEEAGDVTDEIKEEEDIFLPTSDDDQYKLVSVAPLRIKDPDMMKRAKLGIVFGLLIVILCIVFFIRSNNEKSLCYDVANAIYNDGESMITTFYDSVMPCTYDDGGYMLTFDVDYFSVTKTSGNEFDVFGSIVITDLTSDSRPEYRAWVDGTLEANFMRSDWSVEWSFTFDDPMSTSNVNNTTVNTSNTIELTMQDIYNAYSSNPVAADNKYQNHWLTVTGEIMDTRSANGKAYIQLRYYDDYWTKFTAYFMVDPTDPILTSCTIGEYITLTGYLCEEYTGFDSITLENAYLYTPVVEETRSDAFDIDLYSYEGQYSNESGSVIVTLSAYYLDQVDLGCTLYWVNGKLLEMADLLYNDQLGTFVGDCYVVDQTDFHNIAYDGVISMALLDYGVVYMEFEQADGDSHIIRLTKCT